MQVGGGEMIFPVWIKGHSYDAICNTLESGKAEHIFNCFTWKDTPEGGPYWSKQCGKGRLTEEARGKLTNMLEVAYLYKVYKRLGVG